jgi:hypothetical protein
VPAPGKPSPEAPDLHLNNVNAYHRRLKEWMARFHGVAPKNLPNSKKPGPGFFGKANFREQQQTR